MLMWCGGRATRLSARRAVSTAGLNAVLSHHSEGQRSIPPQPVAFYLYLFDDEAGDFPRPFISTYA